MKTFIFTLFALLLFASVKPSLADTNADDSISRSPADKVVDQMRGLNMQQSNPLLDDGKIDPNQQHGQEIINQFRMAGKASIPVLIHALQDSEVQTRRNAELVMINLAGAWDGEPKMDIREAIPALIKATQDADSEVRAWAAHALAEFGPDAKAAVPALIKLVKEYSPERPRRVSESLRKIINAFSPSNAHIGLNAQISIRRAITSKSGRSAVCARTGKASRQAPGIS